MKEGGPAGAGGRESPAAPLGFLMRIRARGRQPVSGLTFHLSGFSVLFNPLNKVFKKLAKRKGVGPHSQMHYLGEENI